MEEMAVRIYQANLDAVSAALMAGDLCAMLEHIAIPNMMATRDCQIVMTCPEELDMVMQDFRAQLLARGMVAYRRSCIEAGFVQGMPDMIAGQHTTTIECRDGSTLPCYHNHSVLLRIDGRWQGIWLEAILDNTDLEILSPDIAAAQAQARRILERSGR
jgi:hypothetical protein